MRSVVAFTICMAFIVPIGCRPNAPPVEVEGTVSYDGQSVGPAIITFLTSRGGAESSAGAYIADGKYRVDPKNDLRPGTYRVEIRWAKPTGEKKENVSYGESPDIITEGLPDKYHSESTLTVELKEGSNTVDFHLEK